MCVLFGLGWAGAHISQASVLHGGSACWGSRSAADQSPFGGGGRILLWCIRFFVVSLIFCARVYGMVELHHFTAKLLLDS